jgi:hypothetical protein
MLMHVRQISSEESKKILQSFLEDNSAIDIRWNHRELCDITLTRGEKILEICSFNYTINDTVFINFYCGVDNIRFDGRVLPNSTTRSILKNLCKAGQLSPLDYL